MSNSGERRISPGPTIYEGKHWLVEHTYPNRLKGWLVIVSKRHVEALHELTKDEFMEFGEICEMTTKILHSTLYCKKEYCMCFAEVEKFYHIHFHIVPRANDLPDELKSSKIFSMLKVDEADSIPREEIIEFCKILEDKFLEVSQK